MSPAIASSLAIVAYLALSINSYLETHAVEAAEGVRGREAIVPDPQPLRVDTLTNTPALDERFQRLRAREVTLRGELGHEVLCLARGPVVDGNRHAAAAHANQREIGKTAIVLENFVRDSRERA